MKVYIAGPMTGIPEYNYPAFHAAAESLRDAGYEPLSPAQDYGEPRGSMPWEWYMRRGLTLLLTADAVALLPGYQHSRGARLEAEIAWTLGMHVRPLSEWVAP